MAHPNYAGLESGSRHSGQQTSPEGGWNGNAGGCSFDGLADTEQHDHQREASPTDNQQSQADGSADQYSGHRSASIARPGPLNGFWRDADWLLCKDGKWRPVEPGTFPLAHGAASRVGRLRAYGNAINAEQATEFIRAHMELIA
jgi:DNA (cytosine-5)-methyltransferase 1